MKSNETEIAAFLAEIRRSGDSQVILAYADWLEDQGDDLCKVLRAVESNLSIGDVCDIAELGGLTDAIARMDKHQRIAFSYNCANRTLPRFENVFPKDKRPRHAMVLVQRNVKLDRDNQAFQEAVDAARIADGARWKATCEFYGQTVDPLAECRTDREAAWQAKSSAIKAECLAVAMAESAFFAARTVVYVCQNSPIESVARSAAFACGDARGIEEEWQLRHAIKILNLGPIPLTVEESLEYSQV